MTQNIKITEIIVLMILQSGSPSSHLMFKMEAMTSSRNASSRMMRISLKNMLFEIALMNLFMKVNLMPELLLRKLFIHHRTGKTITLTPYWNIMKIIVPKFTAGFLVS